MDWLGSLLRAAVPFVSGIPILGPIAAAVVPALFPPPAERGISPPGSPAAVTAAEEDEDEEYDPHAVFRGATTDEPIDDLSDMEPDFAGSLAETLVTNVVQAVQTSWPTLPPRAMTRNLPLESPRERRDFRE